MLLQQNLHSPAGIISFNYKNKPFRIIINYNNNNIEYVAKDISDILELDAEKMTSALDKNEKKEKNTLDRKIPTITESGFYTVLARESGNPKAKHFKRWVSDKIMPAIRKPESAKNNNGKLFEVLDEKFFRLEQIIKTHISGQTPRKPTDRIILEKTILEKTATGNGRTSIEKHMLDNIISHPDLAEKYAKLSRREIEIFMLMLKNLSNSDIARKLDISYFTARNHAVSIQKKLGVSSRQAVLLFASKCGFDFSLTHQK